MSTLISVQKLPGLSNTLQSKRSSEIVRQIHPVLHDRAGQSSAAIQSQGDTSVVPICEHMSALVKVWLG